MPGPDVILKAGGGENVDPPIKSVAVIDLGFAAPEWTSAPSVPSLNYVRKRFHLVVLADGKVLAVGGQDQQSVPVLSPELYDSDDPNGVWKEMKPMDKRRTYHSTALLLPDARALTAGGATWAYDRNAQIYEPPYLFDMNNNAAPRPVINSAPDVIYYGQAFTMLTTDAGLITKVSLIRLGSVTHHFDMNARFVPLSFAAGAAPEILTVNPPANWNIAPPGYYMLFILKDGDRPGIYYPSQAKMVQLVVGGT